MTKLWSVTDMEGNPVEAPLPPGEYQAYDSPFGLFKDASETATIAFRTFGELVQHLQGRLSYMTTRERRAQNRQYAAADRKAKRPRITRVSVPNKGNR